jgi:hypothetical protein
MTGRRPTAPSGRLRLALGAVVVVTALAMATAGAAAATLRVVNHDTRPHGLTPGFLLDPGRYRTIEAPDPGVLQ